MEESKPQMISRDSAERTGLGGRSSLPTILSRMVWKKERIVQLWKQ
jgi:hypothetical protein